MRIQSDTADQIEAAHKAAGSPACEEHDWAKERDSAMGHSTGDARCRVCGATKWIG
ncbi:hypothetical protein [Nocardia asteroides]|uniref:hypothetical protein n=1 Tax=Nocardia asteroides TaxID=1824 RepID=UPI0033CE5687